MSATDFDTTLEEVNRLREKRTEQFRELVKRMADGQKVPPAEIDTILTGAGKTTEDLRGRIANRLRRRALRVTIADSEAAVSERERHQAEIDRLNAELEQYLAAHRQKVYPLHQQIQECITRIAAKTDAVRELRERCDDEELLSQQSQNQFAMGQLERKRQEAQSTLERAKANLSSVLADPGKYTLTVEEAKARVDRCAAQVAEINRQRDELREQGEAIARAILED